MIAATASFFVYFKSANAGFANRTVSASDLPVELTRWATWHWARTVVSLGAFGAALLSVAATVPKSWIEPTELGQLSPGRMLEVELAVLSALGIVAPGVGA